MRAGLVAAGLLAVLASATPVLAQNVRDIPGPRETPPSSFRGGQYVDSGGCVFLRAGEDGRVIWVPRVDARRKVLCGYPPTMAQAAVTPALTDDAATDPAPRVAAVSSGERLPGKAPAAKAVSCPPGAPVAARAALLGGGTVVLCLPRDGRLSGAARVVSLAGAASVPAASSPSETVLVCPRAAPVARRLPLDAGGTTLLCTPGNGGLAPLALPQRRAVPATDADGPPMQVTLDRPGPAELIRPVVPAGYKLAWKDDRLNPARARGTAAGQAAQDRIWTRETPARLLVDLGETERVNAASAPSSVRVSTRSGPEGVYVQVGSFGQPANAAAARARLLALGLPVARGRVTQAGRTVEVVMAGPFDRDRAGEALVLARADGFSDAILTD